ncbi:protein of unknown function [Hathewaya proteolytica DSM 3090]|uniref:DUF4364 domain-containing protein n=1 Tax=Hathewaya proteolytica DSM 3090 TaxID=1121331 RepID=A0A1M6SG26_9CLOT|nr:DUF4364 family protein [Hathewaya proteolytica]SHK43646.1 protein of unknown function [Hathewaya proteolytica DSM 3090]
MNNDFLELAENKLLLLYIVNEIKLPLSNLQLTDIVLENGLIDYFNLQQYLLELSSSNLVRYIEGENKIRLVITDKGKDVLSMFFGRLSEDKLKQIDDYLIKHMDSIRQEISIKAEFQSLNDGTCIVNLSMYENEVPTIEIKIPTPSQKEAEVLCSKWKKSYLTMKDSIKNILLSQ